MSDDNTILEFQTSLADQAEPQPLPERDYNGEIRAAMKKTSASGTDYIQLDVFVPAEEYPADYTDGDPDGVTLSFRRLMLDGTPNSRWRLKRLCEAVGVTPGNTLDLNEFVGRSIRIRVKHSEYEGERRADITRLLFDN